MQNPFSNLGKWWSPSDLIATIPPEHWKYEIGYLVMLGVFLALAIALIFMKKVRTSLKDRLYSFLWTNIILGLILFFFRVQQIPLLGMDIWRFIQEIAIVIWIALIVRFYRKVYRKEALIQKVEERKTKYLPKAKAQ